MPVPMRDQRKHVEAAVDDGGPAALEKEPAGPQDHWRSQQELDPIDRARRQNVLQRLARNHVGHRQQKYRNAECDTDPEAPGHIGEFRIFFLVYRSFTRLEGHAADRAGAGPGSNNLRMHRAGVFDASGWLRGDGWFESHPAFRTGSWMVLVDFRIHGADVVEGSGLFCRFNL